MIEIRKKEGESPASHLFRFTKKVQQSGVLKEAKKRKFRKRPANKRQRRLSALYKEVKAREIKKARKMGML